MMLGENLRKLRKSRKLSLKSLSEITNISVSFISDIEHGRTNPSLEKLLMISDKLGVSPSYFLSEKSEVTPLTSYPELLDLLKDFSMWNEYDQQELLYYLKAKKLCRKEMIKEKQLD